ncbi:hypothetical protein QQ045_026512 [Rhodiola kirilowii]
MATSSCIARVQGPTYSPCCGSGARRFLRICCRSIDKQSSQLCISCCAIFSTDRFPPIKLPLRQIGEKDGRPSVAFTAEEVRVGAKRFEYSLVAKFTQKHQLHLKSVVPPGTALGAFEEEGKTTGCVTISNIWDGRHILVILDSELDAMTALACPLWKFVDVDVDERTRACKSLRFARVCVEVDVTKPIPGEVWVNLPNNQGFVQRVEVESKLTFCMKCQIHGHDVMSCRKIVAGNNKGSESLRRKDYDKDMSAKVMKEASATSRSTSEEDKGTKIDSRNKSKDQRSDEWVEVRRKKGSKSVQFIDPKPGDNSDKPILEQARINATEEAATEVVSMLHNIVVDQLFLGESVGIISDDGNNEIDDTLALVAFHAPTNQQEETLLVDNNGSMQQGGVEDMSTTMQVDQIIEVSGDNEVADSLAVVALKESQDQVMTDSGSDAEYDHVLSITNVGGRFYCEEFGGKSFQDAEELIKYSKENGYVGYNRRCP